MCDSPGVWRLLFESFQKNARTTLQSWRFVGISIGAASPSDFKVLVEKVDVSHFAIRHAERIVDVLHVLAGDQVRRMKFLRDGGTQAVGEHADQEGFEDVLLQIDLDVLE